MRDLSQLPKQELLNHTQKLVAEDHRISLLLVEALRECERRMLFAEMGFSSLWEFAVRYLGLSEGSAQLRISAMRLARDIPHTMDRLQSGELSLSNASQLYSFFQAEKKEGKPYSPKAKQEIIQEMIGLSKKECERKLLARCPESLPKEKERAVSETKTELKLILDVSTMEKLQRLKDHLAHSYPQASHGEIIEYLINETLDRLEKKKRGAKPDQSSLNSLHPEIAPVPEIVPVFESVPVPEGESVTHPLSPARHPTPRTYIPVSDRRWVWNRAGGQCEYVSPDGIRCRGTYGLQFDHRTPLALGGKSDRSQLRVLCRNHNIQEGVHQMSHDLMGKYVASLR